MAALRDKPTTSKREGVQNRQHLNVTLKSYNTQLVRLGFSYLLQPITDRANRILKNDEKPRERRH